MLEAADGAISITPTSYEPEAVAAMRTWFGETGRPVYAVGPLLPSASKEAAAANEKKQSGEGSQIQEFLDATLKSSGPKSLLYVSAPQCSPWLVPYRLLVWPFSQISVGSIFWPLNKPENIWAILEVVSELNIPFVSALHRPLLPVTAPESLIDFEPCFPFRWSHP